MSHRKTKNRHHLKPRFLNGETRPENLLSIEIEKHNIWHKLFKNLDLYQVIELLIRVARMKNYEKVNPKIVKFYNVK